MSKKLDSEDPILSKYSKPRRQIDQSEKEQEELRLKRLEKEKQRKIGLTKPKKEDEEHERELQIIATRGVVQLFNTVTEAQVNSKKAAQENERESKSGSAKLLREGES